MVHFEEDSCRIDFEPYTALNIEIKVPHSFPFSPNIPLTEKDLAWLSF